MDLGAWYSAVTDEIASELRLARALSDVPTERGDHAVHLAVLVEPFLSFILDGSKRIESRFSTVKVPPFRAVHEGDLLLLKQAGGPIVAATSAAEVWCYGSLSSGVLATLRDRFGPDLRDDVPGFWEDRDGAQYATFIRLGRVAKLKAPLDCPKTDRRGWVILRARSHQLRLFG